MYNNASRFFPSALFGLDEGKLAWLTLRFKDQLRSNVNYVNIASTIGNIVNCLERINQREAKQRYEDTLVQLFISPDIGEVSDYCVGFEKAAAERPRQRYVARKKCVNEAIKSALNSLLTNEGVIQAILAFLKARELKEHLEPIIKNLKDKPSLCLHMSEAQLIDQLAEFNSNLHLIKKATELKCESRLYQDNKQSNPPEQKWWVTITGNRIRLRNYTYAIASGHNDMYFAAKEVVEKGNVSTKLKMALQAYLDDADIWGAEQIRQEESMQYFPTTLPGWIRKSDTPESYNTSLGGGMNLQ